MTTDVRTTNDVRGNYGTPAVARLSVLALLVIVAAIPWLPVTPGLALSIALIAPVMGVGYAFVMLLISWLFAIETWSMKGGAGDRPTFHSCISWLYVFPGDSPNWWERPLYGSVQLAAAVATGVALSTLL